MNHLKTVFPFPLSTGGNVNPREILQSLKSVVVLSSCGFRNESAGTFLVQKIPSFDPLVSFRGGKRYGAFLGPFQ